MENQSLTPPQVSFHDVKARMAAELATKLMDPKEIASRYDMTPKELTHLLKHDVGFRKMVKTFRQEWEAAESTTERIRLKAGMAVESLLEDLHAIAVDPTVAPSARIDAFKNLVVVADAAPKKDAGPDTGTKFQISINVPTVENVTTAPITIDATDYDTTPSET